MKLRALVVAQIAWIALLGAAARGALPSPSLPSWAEAFIGLGNIALLIGLPVAVFATTRRARLSPERRFLVVGIEVVLIYTTLLALAPTVQ